MQHLLRAVGVDNRLDIVPGAMHSAAHVPLAVNAFFLGAQHRRNDDTSRA
ncbi:hypothetical protein [Variovorax sp. OV329]|nr:hypothetical protein [Variovorax sp. OV329]